MRIGQAAGLVVIGAALACFPDHASQTSATGGTSSGEIQAPSPAPKPKSTTVAVPQKSMEPLSPAALSPAPPVIYRVGGNVLPPKLIHRVAPDYKRYRELRLASPLVVEGIIGVDGLVKDVRVLRPTGREVDSTIVEAIKQWRYQPATLNGKPVPVYLNLTVNIDFQ